MSELTLETASFDQLKQIAELAGLDVAADMDLAALKSLIKDSMGDDPDFSVLQSAPYKFPAKKASSRKKSSAKASKSDMVRLILSEQSGAGGDRPVPVGVNGKIMLIPRGEEVEIPRSYFEVLKAAQTQITNQESEHGILKTRDVSSYPFQLLSA